MASQSSLFLCVVLLLVFMVLSTNGLQCHICGQFNDGVGSITPCLNYTETNAHLHLKDCPRKTDKFCVVSKCSSTQNLSLAACHLPQKLKSTFSIITFFLHMSSENCFLLLVCGKRSEKKKTCWSWREKLFWNSLVGKSHSSWDDVIGVITLRNERKGMRSTLECNSALIIWMPAK